MDEVQSTNINSLWLDNIYENLKNLEKQFKLAFEGCNDVMEYCGIPMYTRPQILADTQYKNMRFIVTELRLLIKDVSPVIPDDYQYFLNKLKPIVESIGNRRLFVKELKSESKQAIISSRVTPFFHETLNYLNEINLELVLKIKHLLYIDDSIKSTHPATPGQRQT